MVDTVQEMRSAVEGLVEAARQESLAPTPTSFDPRPAKPSLLDRVEARILRLGGASPEEKGGTHPEMPVTHRFTPGLYIREITMPAGSILTSKVHMTEHPYTVSQGHCLVLTEGGEWQEVRAPHTGITQPGTRRLLLTLEETVWTTYHPTDLKDPAAIEDEILLDYRNPLLVGEKSGSLPEEASG